jgi:hypothetical protein
MGGCIDGHLRLGALFAAELVTRGRDDLRFATFPEPMRRVMLPSYATLDLSGGFTLLTARGSTPGVGLNHQDRQRVQRAL